MNTERWHRIGSVFQRAVELPEGERSAFLDAECAGDAELDEHVRRLLHEDGMPSELVDRFDELVAFDDQGLPRLERPKKNTPDPWVGLELGPYRLTSRIATGGMGVVYEALRTDGAFDRRVAVKLIRAEWATEETYRRFELERRTLASLDHPNIARLYDGGTTDDGLPYFVMERVEGLPIDRYCDAAELTVSERLKLFVSICRAVHFAHTNLVVHRDLKPDNILIDENGAPKLLDFGIARLVGEDEGEPIERTRTSARMLTPEYASPEQLTGGPITTATDVYSLGVVLFRLLTGAGPFHCESRSPVEWERLVTERAPTRPSSSLGKQFASSCGTTPAKLRRRLAGDVDRIVLMTLRKEPERRYGSARELADDIEAHLTGQPVVARGDSLSYRSSKFVQRHRVAVAAAAFVLAALVVGILVARRGQQLAEAEAKHARIEYHSLQDVTDFLMSTFLTSEMVNGEENLAAARESTQHHAQRVRRQYPDEVHLRANLLDALGGVSLRLDLFDDCEALVREALALREAEFGERSLEVALSLGSLGELQFRRGDFGAAEESLRRALELHRTLPVGTHTNVAAVANNLAAALRNTNELQESEQLHTEALALRRAVGESTLPVSESLNNLAAIRLDRGEFASARELLAEALEIRRGILGPSDVLTAQSLSNLGTVQWNLGEIETAEELLLDAEAGYRAAREQGKDGLAEVLGNLAVLSLQSGDLQLAETRLNEAVEIRAKSLGPDHPQLASMLRKIALLQRLLERHSEAGETWTEILRIQRAAYSPTSPVLGRSLQEYGVFLFESGDLERAEDALHEAVEILTESALGNEAILARAELCLGMCHLVTDRLDAAELWLQRGQERLRESPGVTDEQLETASGYLNRLEAARQAQ